MLALSEEHESQTSSSSDLGADALALGDSPDLSADTPTFEADRSSSLDCGADTPKSVECGAECCKDGNTEKLFQARNQSIKQESVKEIRFGNFLLTGASLVGFVYYYVESLLLCLLRLF